MQQLGLNLTGLYVENMAKPVRAAIGAVCSLGKYHAEQAICMCQSFVSSNIYSTLSVVQCPEKDGTNIDPMCGGWSQLGTGATQFIPSLETSEISVDVRHP